MDGILIIDKPAGITSHDVVSRVRRTLKTKRVGHTGTLDPFATGVMVVLVGRATRLARFLDKDEKEYLATVNFGYTTTTGDRTGTRNAECGIRSEEIAEHLLAVDWDDVLAQFRGQIEQVPPMYSAKKVAGKKLYELARRGETIERAAVQVNISKLELESTPERNADEPDTWNVDIRVRCSAGTYIRTLAEDIGRELGFGAHLTELRRTAAGRFTIDESVTLDRLAETDDPSGLLIKMSAAIEHLPRFDLRPDRVKKTLDGMSTRATDVEFEPGEKVRMMTDDDRLIAIGEYDLDEKVVRPRVVLG